MENQLCRAGWRPAARGADAAEAGGGGEEPASGARRGRRVRQQPGASTAACRLVRGLSALPLTLFSLRRLYKVRVRSGPGATVLASLPARCWAAEGFAPGLSVHLAGEGQVASISFDSQTCQPGGAAAAAAAAPAADAIELPATQAVRVTTPLPAPILKPAPAPNGAGLCLSGLLLLL